MITLFTGHQPSVQALVQEYLGRDRFFLGLIFIGTALWVSWLQWTWVTYTWLQVYATAATILACENYLVNVKLDKMGTVETNPFWATVVKVIPFQYAVPTMMLSVFAIVYLGQPPSMGPPEFIIVASLAGALPVAVIVSINDILILRTEKAQQQLLQETAQN